MDLCFHGLYRISNTAIENGGGGGGGSWKIIAEMLSCRPSRNNDNGTFCTKTLLANRDGLERTADVKQWPKKSKGGEEVDL